MKIFGYELRRAGAESKSSSRDLLQEIFGGKATKSGAAVNWKTALEVTTVLACARVIAEGLAQVPFRIYRDQSSGGKAIASDHPVHPLISRRPNEWMTSFELRELIGLHLVLCGNFFAVKIRGPRGNVLELLPYTPGAVTVKRNNWQLSYEVQGDNGTRTSISADDMWHIRGPSWNSWMGLESVKILRESIGLALATEEHGARVFSNGARVGGVLSSDVSKMDPEQVKALRASWDATQGGNANSWKTAILWGGLKWQALAQQNDQAQLIEQRRFQVEEICRGLRVLPIMVGHSDKTQTFASAEQMFLAHVVHTMGPWYKRIEESANVQLLSDADADKGYYAKFVVQGLMRGAAKDRMEYYKGMYGIGALNPNEIRELEDWNPYQGGEQYRVPLNMEDPNSPSEDPGKNQAGADNVAP